MDLNVDTDGLCFCGVYVARRSIFYTSPNRLRIRKTSNLRPDRKEFRQRRDMHHVNKALDERIFSVNIILFYNITM